MDLRQQRSWSIHLETVCRRVPASRFSGLRGERWHVVVDQEGPRVRPKPVPPAAGPSRPLGPRESEERLRHRTAASLELRGWSPKPRGKLATKSRATRRALDRPRLGQRTCHPHQPAARVLGPSCRGKSRRRHTPTSASRRAVRRSAESERSVTHVDDGHNSSSSVAAHRFNSSAMPLEACGRPLHCRRPVVRLGQARIDPHDQG